MITEKTLNKYKEYIGKTIGTLKVEDIDLSIPINSRRSQKIM